jgi:peptidoglycan/LPS O-acetylase OafA/YrhL
MHSAATLTDRPSLVWLNRGRVPSLDGLRAVSIALVIIEHASMTAGFPAHTVQLGALGHIGVSMFFAISGFLITMLLARERNHTGRISLLGFYRRRALRILPAYVCFMLGVFVLTRLDVVALRGGEWTALLTYTVNFLKNPTWDIGHVWSLSVEEQFYLVWPFVLLFLPLNRAFWVVLAYLAAAPVVRVGIWLFFRDHLQIIEDFTPLRLDAIASGCLLALLASRPSFQAHSLRVSRYAVWAAALATASLIVSFVAAQYVDAFNLTIRYSSDSLAMTVIIWSLAIAPMTMVGRWLNAKWMVLIGTLSYSLYLWQQLFLNPHRAHWTAMWPYNLVLVMITAGVSYYVIESPFLRMKDHPGSRVRGASPAVQEV